MSEGSKAARPTSATMDYRRQQPEATQPERQEKEFYHVPEGAPNALIMDILASGEELGNLPDRKKTTSKDIKLDVKGKGKSRTITQENGANTTAITVELSDIDKLAGSNKAAKKLFIRCGIEANRQAITNGKLTQDHISFPLQRLVDDGNYSNLRSARKGFTQGADVLTSIKIKGKVTKSKKDEAEIEALEVPFTGSRISKGQCIVFLNPRINWSFFTQYFTALPPYCFKLSNRAFDLLYYIFSTARQRTHDIEQRGYFTISFRAIQYKLQLPNEVGAANPQRDIKDAIENAIEEIENEHSAAYANADFTITPVYNENAPIAEYLDNGYLKVELKNDFAKTFIEISKSTAKQIAAAQKRKEKKEQRREDAINKAIAAKEAEAYHAEDQMESETA